MLLASLKFLSSLRLVLFFSFLAFLSQPETPLLFSPLMSCSRSPITEPSDRRRNSSGFHCIIYSWRKGRRTSIILLYTCNANTDGLCLDECMQMHVRPDNICHVDQPGAIGCAADVVFGLHWSMLDMKTTLTFFFMVLE